MDPSVALEKNPQATPLGIDPETLQLVAQCLNHYTTPGPPAMYRINLNKEKFLKLFVRLYFNWEK
jgi:hypothetical protein